ncbi:cytidine deaminase-like protein [Camillea tinctor]|nr:cytidine deaminase-like protein [Camillea tinctor]
MDQPPTHSPTALLRALLSTIETHVVPLTAAGIAGGSKVFGAAVLSGADLAPLTAATNDERRSPLLHGEVNCIQRFFAQERFPAAELRAPSPAAALASGKGGGEGENPPYPLGSARPSPRACVFLATHEPCCLCLSALAWSGFARVYYLFSYADTRDVFAIPYDIDILQAVFRVPCASSPSLPAISAIGEGSKSKGEGEEGKKGNESENGDERPLYNRTNKFFTARSVAELVAEVDDPEERQVWEKEIARVRGLYDELGERYQRGKREGVGSASFWK